MDKYEFNIKVEQIKKLTNEGDYVTAMKIADSIDWSRVRNANLLSMIAEVYEQNAEYQEAKDILLLAFERAPVGKRLLYKLAELSVKSGDIEEAEDFYREFIDLAPDDSRAFLLEYMILKAKGAPAGQLINSLEKFTSQDIEERWLYELAELYARAGMGAECVRVCDKITLLFGLGKYSERALQLKQNFTDLSEYQRDLVENRGKYEDRLREVEAESAQAEAMYARGYEAAAEFEHGDTEDGFDGCADEEPYRSDVAAREHSYADELANDRYEDEDAAFEAYLKSHSMELSEPVEDEDAEDGGEQLPEVSVSYDEEYEERLVDGVAEEVARFSREENGTESEADPLGETKVLEDDVKEKLRRIVIRTEHLAEQAKAINVDQDAVVAGAMKQAAALAAAAAPEAKTDEAEPAEIAENEEPSHEERVIPEPPRPQARVGFTAKETLKEEASEKETEEPAAFAEEALEAAPETGAEAELQTAPENGPFHMIIEAEQEGLEIAIDELKYIHTEYGIANAAAKTTAEKLNQKGLSKAALAKLAGKDFIIEHAGSLREDIIDTVYDLIREDRTGMIIVLIDTPEGLDRLEELRPELFDICDVVSDEADFQEEPYDGGESGYEESEVYDDEDDMREDVDEEAYDEAFEDEEPVKQERPAKSFGQGGKRVDEREMLLRKSAPADAEEMEIDEFAQYCCQYAASIDCSITGKSMLALYERIELMEEDNIPLTKETAEDLIEEAADLAEKPPIGKRIKGMFNSKYDKAGMLILREEDFIR